MISLVLSADTNNDPDVLAINGASCALAVSDIPFPHTVGAVRVDQRDVSVTVLLRQLAQPRDPLLAELVVGDRGVHVEQQPQQRPESRRAFLEAGAPLGHPQQLVGVADDAGPAQLADQVDDFGSLTTHQCKVAAVDDLLDAAALDVRDDGLERCQVAVDV